MTLGTGLMNKQIAAELGISEITVKVHRGNILKKMGAHSLAGLLRMADALGNTGREAIAALNFCMILSIRFDREAFPTFNRTSGPARSNFGRTVRQICTTHDGTS
jgi:hypothetical protein